MCTGYVSAFEKELFVNMGKDMIVRGQLLDG